MTTTFALDKNWWEKVYDLQDIYEFTKYEKGVKRTEAEKFRNIAQYTMLYLSKDVFSENISNDNYFTPSNLKTFYQPFVDRIASNSSINTKPFNPKVMAFTFLYLVNIQQTILFSQKTAMQCLKMIQRIEHKIRDSSKLNAFESSMKTFMKETGMNSENLIRYFLLYKNMFPNIEK